MATVKNLLVTTIGATLVALGLGGAAQAAIITFDESELQQGQPIDGVSIKGVTFDYKQGGVDSTVARVYNALSAGYSGGTNGYTGRGTLTLDFAAPTPVLNFDFVQGRVLRSTTVALLDPTSKFITSINLIPSRTFSGVIGEGQFTYSGELASRAVVDFNTTETGFFRIDNLTYEPVPEPLTIIGSGMALGFGALMERQYSKKRKKA